MKKISWPWIGTTEHEMGSMTKSFKDVDQSGQEYDMLTPAKSIVEGTESEGYTESKVSPIDNDGEELSSFANFNKLSQINVCIKSNSFVCNIAKTWKEKVEGLQSYSSLKENDGLLFPYKKVQDVMYHMGTVNYPIDIIFIDDSYKIKKIYHNIQPGSLATFGCANVKYVLEINGGLSKSLNLKVGDDISFNNKMAKTASKKELIPDIIYAYYLDSLINKNPLIKIDIIADYDEDNIKLGINNQIYTSKKSIDIDIKDLHKYNSFEQYNISKTAASFENFLENSEEVYSVYNDLKNAFSENNSIVVFATAINSPIDIYNVFISKLEILYGNFKKKNVIIHKIGKEHNHINLIEDLRFCYPHTEIKLSADNDFMKNAGVPIPDSIKEQARTILKFLDAADNYIINSLDDLQHNLKEYETIKDSTDKIKSTQGQYHQSIKNNIDTVKKYLVNIRDAIKIFNKIKDASTTMEIIDSLASTSQVVSEAVQEIFDLVNKIENPSFFQLLTEKTQSYEKSIEDLQSTIDMAKDYINTEILGIIVLT